MIEIGKSGRHSFAQGLIRRTPQERIQPDQSLHLSLQMFHLRIEKLRIPPVPAVTENKNDGSTRDKEVSVVVVEVMKRGADIRPPGPVSDPF